MSRIVAMACMAAALMLPGAALATSGGQLGNSLRPGDTGNGCVGCHNAAGVVSTAIVGTQAILPGATARYSISVSGITNATAKVGFNAAVTKNAMMQPTFSAVAGEPLATGDGSTQITHSSGAGALRTATGGSASYLVDLTVPVGASLGSTFTLYAVGNAGRSATQVGWNHAPNLTVTVAPPTPSSLTPDQNAATTTQIPLSWSGTQGEHFRVLRKTGSFPTSATDAGATLVYEGPNTSANAAGLSAGTNYFFAAYGRAPAANFYSTNAAQATAASLPNNPTALTANGLSASEVALSWTGTSAEYRVLRKTGSYPASATDASATVVYQGTNTSFNNTGLAAGTEYFYRVWGKVAGAAVYSAGNAQDTATTSAQPTPRFVAASGGNDAGNDCSAQASPCRTITHAMSVAGSGDLITVAPGTYDVALGEVFPIEFKSGVQLESSAGAWATIIDGSGDSVADGLIRSTSNSSSLSRIEGFTIRNGFKTPEQGGVALGGAIYIEYGSSGAFTLRNNVIANNEARGYTADGTLGQTGGLAWGGAIGIFQSVVHIQNNLFTGNLARGGGGQFHPESPITNNESGGVAYGGAIWFSGSGSIVGNTFHNNRAIGGDGGVASNGVGSAGPGSGGAVNAGGSPGPSIANNIFSHNAAQLGAGGAFDSSNAGALTAATAVSIDNNLFFANEVDGGSSVGDDQGDAAVLADPAYHAAPGNLRLRLSSPARGAGLAGVGLASDFDGAARPTPPAIGAYEGSLVAQQIVFGPAPVVSVGGSAAVNVSGGDSGNPVVLSSLTPTACSVAGLSVNGLSAATCTLAANQAGGGDFAAAAQETLSFPVLAAPSFQLTVSRSGTGSGQVLSSPEGIACGDFCQANFPGGTPITLSATADAGSAFAGWSGGGCSGTGSCVVTLSGATAVSAQFVELTTFAVSISGGQEVPPNAATGNGFGVAVVNPAANTLTYAFSVTGLSGSLTGAHFHGAAARGASAGVKIDIGANPFAGTVNFNQVDEADLLAGLWYVNYHTATFPGGEIRGQLDNLGGLTSLSTAVSGSGGGSVTSSPAGIDCGATCLAAFVADSTVTLTANPSPVSVFVEWTGACSGSDPVCHVHLTQASSATAVFAPDPAASVDVFADGFE